MLLLFKMSDSLLQKKCVPCEGGEPRLTPEEIPGFMAQLPEAWDLVDNIKISKKFIFEDFKEAMKFVNKVAEIAESEGHHPDIYIFYSKVKIELWTHAIAGLHQNDFILAAKIEEALKEFKK